MSRFSVMLLGLGLAAAKNLAPVLLCSPEMLKIPDADRQQLERLTAEQDETVDTVISALGRARPALRRYGLAAEVAKNSGVAAGEAEKLVSVFVNVSSTFQHLDNAEDEITQAVLGDNADPGKKERFLRRVHEIIDCEAVQITAKALSVLLDDAKTFCEARTLSQIRPVFRESTLEPAAAVVVHQLKIVYHSGGENGDGELFVSLDRGQLEQLRKVIDRAIDKDTKLAATAQKLGLPLLAEDAS